MLVKLKPDLVKISNKLKILPQPISPNFCRMIEAKCYRYCLLTNKTPYASQTSGWIHFLFSTKLCLYANIVVTTHYNI